MEKQHLNSSPDESSVAGRIVVLLVRVYQATLSPWMGRNCRHEPSCSNYMIEAVREWGAGRGVWMGLKRIGRCHPWGGSGYDPVPKRKKQDESTEHTDGVSYGLDV